MIAVVPSSTNINLSYIDQCPFRVLFWWFEVDTTSTAALVALDPAFPPFAIALAADGWVAFMWNETQHFHVTARAEVVTLTDVCHCAILRTLP